MSVSTIQILIAEDSAEFREGLRDLFKTEFDIQLVGEASNGFEAINLAKRLQPDVILMDLHMPDLDGIKATRQILRSSPHIAILVLTMFDDDESVFVAMRAGARGYLLKGALKQEILRAIRGAVQGEAIFSSVIARRMQTYFSKIRPAEGAFPELTDREQEILTLIALGKKNQEIARQLDITLKTVQNHISNIFTKLPVSDRAEAILRAREAGLGKGKFG
jgi:DNA-binding NarL/FixJ family response regulator